MSTVPANRPNVERRRLMNARFEPIHTFAAVAARWGVTRGTVYLWVRRNQIPQPITVRGRRRFTEQQVLDVIDCSPSIPGLWLDPTPEERAAFAHARRVAERKRNRRGGKA